MPEHHVDERLRQAYPEPLSKQELEALRRIIKRDEHWAWLWTGTRHVGGWLILMVGAFAAWRAGVLDFKEWLRSFLQ